MKTRLLIALLTAFTLYGQEASVPAPLVSKEQFDAVIIPVKTLTGDSFDRLVRMLGIFGARFAADSQLRSIVVYAPKDVVTQMRRVIDELDRPGSEAAIGRNVDMTITLLKCSTKPASSASALPPDIEAVARQLRSATQYKDIQVWDIVPLRIQEGKQAQQSLRLPGSELGGQAATTFWLDVLPEAVGRRVQGRYVRFSRLNLNFKIPVLHKDPTGMTIDRNVPYQEVDIHTAGDFIEGQKAVLGKVSGAEEDSAIFAIITLKVLD